MFTLFFILFLFLLLCSVIVAFFYQIITQSIKKEGDLGINFKSIKCPQCQKKTVLQRLPTIKDIPWGGGICSFCGCRMDKWGNEINKLNVQELPKKQLENNQEIPAPNFSESGKTPLEKVFEENDS